MYQGKCLEKTMCAEKMLEIVNECGKNARDRQCKVRKCSEIVNVCGKNAWDDMSGKAESLGIHNVCGKNARNHQCERKKCSESSMCAEKILGIVNAR